MLCTVQTSGRARTTLGRAAQRRTWPGSCGPPVNRGISHIGNSTPLGPCSETMPRALWWPQGWGLFLMSEVPLQPLTLPIHDCGGAEPQGGVTNSKVRSLLRVPCHVSIYTESVVFCRWCWRGTYGLPLEPLTMLLEPLTPPTNRWCWRGTTRWRSTRTCSPSTFSSNSAPTADTSSASRFQREMHIYIYVYIYIYRE